MNRKTKAVIGALSVIVLAIAASVVASSVLAGDDDGLTRYY